MNGSETVAAQPAGVLVTSKIWMFVLVAPFVLRPENAMMRPSPSAVAVPYHRPSAMLWDWYISSVTGSRNAARLSPVNA